jgi:hypothetical protein
MNVFQKSWIKYLEENYPVRQKTTIVDGEYKKHPLKHLSSKHHNLFDTMAKMLYHDHKSTIVDDDDKINLDCILHYTDRVAAKTFFDEAYQKLGGNKHGRDQ